MKKYIAALLTALLLLCTALSAGAVGPALTTTEAYCIMDADTGLVLAQQNMNEELHPASITKVMTLGLACQKAQGNWDGVKLTVSHEDVYSLAGTDSSHIALREGEEVPLQDALYGTMIASANDGANLLAEYFGGGTIEGGVAAMNAQVAALGLQHTHFANPHGISGDDHYTSCYDMAQILRWALTQPGFETIFTRLEMYTMAPTNVQPVTRYFSQQDKMRLSYSRYYIPAIRGSKIGYTNIARYSYVCLAEQNGVRLICVTMQSEMKTDKYNDVRTLLDYAFARYTGYTDLPSQGLTGEVEVVGGGVLRGLHFQKNHTQGKLVRVTRGEVFDVAVDCRPNSATFGKWVGVTLSEENKKMFYIPEGFAHGFLVLSDVAEFCYKCTDVYDPTSEGGIPYDDPTVNVQWPDCGCEHKTSAKDKLHEPFAAQKFEYFEKW